MRQLARDGNGGERRLRNLLLWTGLILLLVVPWFSWQTHPHWDRVQWTPFLRPLRVVDALVNVLMYLPFGYAASRMWPRRAVWWLLGLALALSLGTELTQVYSHGRFPSVRDVSFNLFGAWLGTGLRKWGPAATHF